MGRMSYIPILPINVMVTVTESIGVEGPLRYSYVGEKAKAKTFFWFRVMSLSLSISRQYNCTLKTHSNRAKSKGKMKIFFDVCRLSFDFLKLLFDLFHFHCCFRLVWKSAYYAGSESTRKYSLSSHASPWMSSGHSQVIRSLASTTHVLLFSQ